MGVVQGGLISHPMKIRRLLYEADTTWGIWSHATQATANNSQVLYLITVPRQTRYACYARASGWSCNVTHVLQCFTVVGTAQQDIVTLRITNNNCLGHHDRADLFSLKENNVYVLTSELASSYTAALWLVRMRTSTRLSTSCQPRYPLVK